MLKKKKQDVYWTTLQDVKNIEVSGSCSNRVTLNSSATAHKFNSKTRKQQKSSKTTQGIYITTFDCVCGVLMLRLHNFYILQTLSIAVSRPRQSYFNQVIGCFVMKWKKGGRIFEPRSQISRPVFFQLCVLNRKSCLYSFLLKRCQQLTCKRIKNL